jgi:hypothetical protein
MNKQPPQTDPGAEKAIRGSGALEVVQTAGIFMGGAGGLAGGIAAVAAVAKSGKGGTPSQPQASAQQPPA